MKNPIETAVAPLRAAAVARSLEAMRQQVARVIAENPIGTDLSAKFPRPNGSMNRRQYTERRALRGFLSQILTTECKGGGYNAPEIVTGSNEVLIERLYAETECNAAADFDAYVAKLSAKVGECDAATVAGYLWEGSTLTVTKGATVEQWKTKQIINVSCLGKVFNQWPTRLAK